MKSIAVLLALSALLSCSLAAQTAAPLYETRAVWFATVLGDGGWPDASAVPEAQAAALRARIRAAHDLGLNTFIFQAVGRGDAFYPSTRLPWSPRPKGAGEDPGYDPLAVAIEAAHALGMEVHAWFNVFRVGDSSTLATFAGVTDPVHVAYAQPGWVEAVDGNLWLDPSSAEARAWLVGNVVELVTLYDVDAIHFDFIRYPQGGLPGDGDRFQADPDNGDYASLGDWRRAQVTAFVRDAWAAIQAEKPYVKVGSAPIGNYRDNGWPALYAYSDVFQASRDWLAEGVHDYLAPQLYWNLGDNPPHAVLTEEWVDEGAGRPIFAGIGAYVDDVKPEVGAQIEADRAAGAAGQVFFRYDHMLEAQAQIAARYATRALPAPMPHRFEAAAPAVPGNLALTEGENTATLSWAASEGTAADPLRAYVVFRRVGEAPDPARAEDLFAVVAAGTRTFTESFDAPPGAPIYYRLAAVSRLGILSEATATVSTGQAVAVEGDEASRSMLLRALIYPNPSQKTVTVDYELGEPADVGLVVYDALGRTVATLTPGRQGPGRHRAEIDTSAWPSGRYHGELRAGAERRALPFVIAR